MWKFVQTCWIGSKSACFIWYVNIICYHRVLYFIVTSLILNRESWKQCSNSLIILKTTPLTGKNNPDDFEDLLQRFLIVRNKFFPSLFAVFKSSKRFFLVGIHLMQGWTATKRHGVIRKKREKRWNV